MMLLTKAIIKKLPKPYSTEKLELENKNVVAKFFTPWGNWTWFVFEGEEVEGGDYRFFGMVHGQTNEMGYFLLSELQSVKGPFGLKIERDRSVSGVAYGTGNL